MIYVFFVKSLLLCRRENYLIFYIYNKRRHFVDEVQQVSYRAATSYYLLDYGQRIIYERR